MSNFEDVKKFMQTFGQIVETKPQFPDEKTMKLRFDLIQEELNELKEAMEIGGLHRLKENYEWDELYRYVSKLIPYGETIQNQVFEQLVQREELSSTALGHGIAVPHPRIPMKLELQDSLVLSVCLEHPIDLKAPDQKPVFSLFLLLSREAREHLQFLSQIAKVLNVPSMPSFLSQSPSQEQLLEQFHQILAQ